MSSQTSSAMDGQAAPLARSPTTANCDAPANRMALSAEVSKCRLVDIDAEAGAGWKLQIALADLERVFDVAFAQRYLLLAEEIRDGG